MAGMFEAARQAVTKKAPQEPADPVGFARGLVQASQEMRATPRNPVAGWIADALKTAHDYTQRANPTMPMGKANPALAAFADLASLGSLATTADRLSYGEPLTNRGKANVPFLKPETADVAMMAPISPRSALAALGMVGGMADNGAMRAAGMLGQTSTVTKKEMIAQIREALAATGTKRVGLRVLPPDQRGLEVGAVAPPSWKWKNGDYTDKRLPGASAASIGKGTDAEIARALRNLGVFETGPNGFYFGPKVALIQGAGATKGADVGETVIREAQIKWLADNPRWKD